MMKINLDKKRFKSIENTGNGKVSHETIFNYFQQGEIIWAEYRGVKIVLTEYWHWTCKDYSMGESVVPEI